MYYNFVFPLHITMQCLYNFENILDCEHALESMTYLFPQPEPSFWWCEVNFKMLKCCNYQIIACQTLVAL